MCVCVCVCVCVCPLCGVVYRVVESTEVKMTTIRRIMLFIIMWGSIGAEGLVVCYV